MKKTLSALFVVFCCLVVHNLFASEVLLNAKQMATPEVTNIFTAQCESSPVVKKLPDKRAATKYICRNFKDVIRGPVPENNVFEFYQVGADAAEAKKLGAIVFRGINDSKVNYQKGVYYTQFFICQPGAPFNLDVPLCALKGGGQGIFKVEEKADGTKAVVNSTGNYGLFKGMPKSSDLTKAMGTSKAVEAPTPNGPIEYNSFIQMMKGMDAKGMDTKK